MVAANTNAAGAFDGYVVVDRDIAHDQPQLSIVLSNAGSAGSRQVETVGALAAVRVSLAPSEIQVLAKP